jgi:hypothetical protein
MALAVQNTNDGLNYTGAVTGSVILFTLLGGKYSAFASAADTTNVLSVLLPDGSTYAAYDSETTSAFTKMLDLPAGSYKVVVTSATLVAGGVQRVPYTSW